MNISELAEQLGVSKPVFCFVSKYDGEQVELIVKHKYVPLLEDKTDPVAQLVVNRHHEYLNIEERRFEKSVNEEMVYMDIMRSLTEIYEKNAGLRNPKQAKTYKWLRNMRGQYNHPSRDGFIALFRYAMTQQDDKIHINNILAILEKIREKHEKS